MVIFHLPVPDPACSFCRLRPVLGWSESTAEERQPTEAAGGVRTPGGALVHPTVPAHTASHRGGGEHQAG